ncbi:MAG TPA: hypothetical protein VHM20_07060 [Gammaproteobacteria bacterium]|nr:hypothetical protein [Gammaproteobacteria bacterium]
MEDKWQDEYFEKFEDLSLEERIDEYRCTLNFLIDACRHSSKEYKELADLFHRNAFYYILEEGNDEWICINNGYVADHINSWNIPRLNSNDKWSNAPIHSFKEYFDIKEIRHVTRPKKIKDKFISDKIIYYTHRLRQYFHLVNNCENICGQYDLVSTKYGPTILTSGESDKEIRYVRKALWLLLNPSVRKHYHYVNEIISCLEIFEEIDNEVFWDKQYP